MFGLFARYWALLLVAGLSNVVWAAPALAQADQDDRMARAKTACLAGRVDEGIELLAQLYTETNDAAHIHNQGRCFQQNGKWRQAITRFREYLRKAHDLDDEQRQRVQGYINDLRLQIRSEQDETARNKAVQPEKPAVPVAKPVEPAPAAPAAAPAPKAEKADDKTPQINVVVQTGGEGAQDDTARTLRIAGITTGAIGVAALAGGLLMGARGQSLREELESEANQGPMGMGSFDQGKQDSLDTARTFYYVGLTFGVAAIAGGAVLYTLGYRRDKKTTITTARAPKPPSWSLAPTHNGAVMSVRF